MRLRGKLCRLIGITRKILAVLVKKLNVQRVLSYYSGVYPPCQQGSLPNPEESHGD